MTYQEQQAKLAEYQRRDEQQRKNYVENHKGPCVPWRGAGGKIGRCIYCGKTPIDIAILQPYPTG